MRRANAADANANAADGGGPEAPATVGRGYGLILGGERGLDNKYNTSE